MKRMMAWAICMIAVLSSVFLIGCSDKKKNHQQTETNKESYEEIKTTTPVVDFYQMYKESIADINIVKIKEVALDYYKNLTFIEDVIDIRICENESNIKSYIGEDYVWGEAIVLEVDTVTYGMENQPDKRFMVLKKQNTGEWIIDNEGR